MSYPFYGCMPIFYYRQMLVEHSMTLFDWIDIASTLPITGTEVHHQILPSYEPHDVGRVRSALEERQLKVSQVTTTPDFTHPDPEHRRAQLKQTMATLDVAASLGASCLRVTAGQRYPETGRREGIGWVVDSFQRLVERANEKGIFLAYENHNTGFFAKYPDFSQRADVFLDIVGEMRGSGLRINYDTGNHVVIGEDPLTVLKEVVDLVVHVHCSDRVRPLDNTHAPAGEGVVEFPRIFDTLRGAGFQGWLSVEYAGTEALDGLKRALAYVRGTWEETSAVDSRR